MKIILKIFGLMIIMLSLKPQIIFSQEKVLAVGEELNYIVYYGFIKLGEVNMQILNKTSEKNLTIYHSRSKMFSYKGIPFVELDVEFESEIVSEGSELYSRRFKAVEKKEDGLIIIEYIFNYDSQYVYVKKSNNGIIEIDKKISINKNVKLQDGLSLFYKARVNSFSMKGNFMIPVFMNESETSVDYYFNSITEEVTVSASDNEIESIRCNGLANFTGVFGMTGEFAGWFTNDDERVPLKAQLNAMIGSITLELDTYKRSGWKIRGD